MKKFLEKFEDKSIEDLKKGFPNYASLFDSIVKLDKESKLDTSRQVSDEFLTLIDSVDSFLFKEENLELLGVAERVERKPEILEEEAINILEAEIEEMNKTIDKSIIDAQVSSKTEKGDFKSRVNIDDLEEITREMLDPEQQYFGVQFTRTEFKQDRFSRVLSMMNSGCKFYTGNVSDTYYLMFKLNDDDRLVVTVKNPIVKYENMFGGSKKVLDVYILSKNEASLDVLYNMIRFAFEQPDGDVKLLISDKDLFNTQQFIGCYQDGYFYEETNYLSQSPQLLDRSSNIKQNFALHFPLQYILTLIIVKQIQLTAQMDGEKTYDEIKEGIEEAIKTQKFKIEGIGEVPHTSDVLTKMQGLNYLDDNLDITSKVNKLLYYTGAQIGRGSSVNPKFNAFSYYIADIKDSFVKSKNKFYSDFNGQSVYHTSKTMSDTDFAIHLSTRLKKEFGFSKAKQKDVFPTKWQATQIFNDYSQYLPMSAHSNLKEYRRESERQKRGLDNIMNFTNDSRNEMFFACIDNPLFNFALNSFAYNFIVKLYSDKKMRVLGPKATASSFQKPIFFLLVDENNDLLAVMKPLGKTYKTGVGGSGDTTEAVLDKIARKKGQLDMFKQTTYFSLASSQNPEPVWEFNNLMTDITKVAIVEVEQGVMIKDVGDLTNESNMEEAKEDVPTQDEDVFIDADGYDQQKVNEAIKENNPELIDIQATIVGLEQVLESNPDDEDIQEELDKKREELIQASANYDKNAEEELKEIQEEKEEEKEDKAEDLSEKEQEVVDDENLEDAIQESDEETDYEEEERLGKSGITSDDIEEMDEEDEDEDIDYGEFM